ncbi:hypothetical protein SAMN02745121_01081 [Nannocystis exedens]|uniref:Thaumatin family protein n=1 Tax=Nannocystis exedens TaxID=54 RepID=A0A1I1UA91_9BACT|nr:hypothetical protein [Nannocystis exedens]PCC71536.1 hypothetical protein NAEX_04613 [Nannocystis exedens]SFD67545.1 hypothetical protein SAMN02745121_01081 [Nannocystis exedens]
MRRLGMMLAASACLAMACGSEKTTSTEGEPTGGEPTSGTSTDAAPTTGALMCEAYLDDEDDGELVVITLANNGAAPLWFEAVGCVGVPPLQITNSQGESVPVLTGCAPPDCQSVMEGDCVRECDPCSPPPGLRLDPGARLEVWWSQQDVEFLDITAECAPGPGCAGECIRGVRRPPGIYEITVTAYKECAGACECAEPDPEMGCYVSGAIEADQPVTVTVPLDYPAVTEIEVPFGE